MTSHASCMGRIAASIVPRIFNTATQAPNPSHSRQSNTLVTTIRAHINNNKLPKAISTLFSTPFPLPFPLYTDLFRLCASEKAIIETRKLESHLMTFTPDPPVFLLNRAIESYGKCGCLKDAEHLFDKMNHRNGGSWNSMITAYSQNGKADDVLHLFGRMNREGVVASGVTFAGVLASCGSVLEFSLLRQVHGLVVKYGFAGNVVLESSLVDGYAKCCVMGDAVRVFEEIENPNDVSWNVIIRRYLEMDEGKMAVKMFCKMVKMKVRPLVFTVSNATLAAMSFSGFKEGVQIHGFGLKINVAEDLVVATTLMNMYAKFGDLVSARTAFDLSCTKDLISWNSMVFAYAMNGRPTEAREVFDQMPERSVVSWNMMLCGYVRCFELDKALDFLILMRRETRVIDDSTLVSILDLCSAIPDVELGKQVHGFIYRHGFFSDVFVGNALLNMYGKCGNLKSTRVWFYQMSHLRDKVSWNALLTSYARHGLSEEAMVIFWKMLEEARPSMYTFATLLAACANIFALEPGKQIHAFMTRNGYDIDIVSRGALVDMYSKCRCIEYALNVFNEVAIKDVVLWNSMILGCAHNGRGDKVFELLKSMDIQAIKPDHITIQGILRACICDARVEFGREYFKFVTDKYCLIPRLEHYESMVELYGRYGYMDELGDFINSMPFEPTESILIKVFDSSREHGCLKLGNWAAEQLNKLNPDVPFQFDIIGDKK